MISAGMLHPGNVYLMECAIQNMPDNGAVVEVGLYGGLSTNLIIHLLQRYQRAAAFFGCDAWIYEGYHDQAGQDKTGIDDRPDIPRDIYSAYIREAFMRATQLLSAGRLPGTCHCTFEDFYDQWAKQACATGVFQRTVQLGGPIAFAYIDGNHAYDFVRRDVENTARHLLPGGFMLLDDTADHLPFGSRRLAQEWNRRGDFELVKKNPNYLLRKKG